MPIVAHNRYFDSDSDYSKWFNFIIEKDNGHSLPLDFNFWDFLFQDSIKKWNLYTYE